MKIIMITTAALLTFLQYKLWFVEDGLPVIWQMKKATESQEIQNQRLEQRNQILQTAISELKEGQQSVESHARQDLGMIKEGETFYQVVNTAKDHV